MVTIKIKPKFKPHSYEKEAWKSKQYIFGIDEVGRGCLAGPVVTACLVLKQNAKHKLLRDSKLLTLKERLIAFDWLVKNSQFSISLMHHRNIDQVNIYQATLISMKRSVHQLIALTKIVPKHILVDAMPIKIDLEPIEILYFTDGERQSVSIAAASIVAKVTRDKLMDRIESFLPGYGFINHKGYATPEHKSKLVQNGSTIIHRKSFLKFLR